MLQAEEEKLEEEVEVLAAMIEDFNGKNSGEMIDKTNTELREMQICLHKLMQGEDKMIVL